MNPEGIVLGLGVVAILGTAVLAYVRHRLTCIQLLAATQALASEASTTYSAFDTPLPKEQTMDHAKRFDYVKFDEDTTQVLRRAKEFYATVSMHIEQTLDDGDAKKRAFQHLEESYMWVGKALRDMVLAKGENPEELPERADI